MFMILYNGYSDTELEEKNVGPDERRYPTRRDEFREQTLVLSLTGFDLERSGNELFKSSSWMLNMEQLSHYIDSLGEEYTIRMNTQFLEFRNTKIYIERNIMGSLAREAEIQGRGDTTILQARFEPYAIFDSLYQSDRGTAIQKAIENVKDASSYLTQINESMKYQVRSMNRYKIDWHKKLTLPFACLVFFFIGAPLGAIIRKGGLGTPAVISIFFFVVWYVISLSGEKLVEEDLINEIAGMWASSYILLPIGIFLTYKASNDSVIMNIDTYLTFFRKVKDYVYRVTFQVKNYNSQKKVPDEQV
jgi:lipopolysaccharide export system permease protein